MLKIKSGPAVGSEQNLLLLSVVICWKKKKVFKTYFGGLKFFILRLTAESFISSIAGEKEESGAGTRYWPDSRVSNYVTEGANMMQNCNFILNLRILNSNEIQRNS